MLTSKLVLVCAALAFSSLSYGKYWNDVEDKVTINTREIDGREIFSANFCNQKQDERFCKLKVTGELPGDKAVDDEVFGVLPKGVCLNAKISTTLSFISTSYKVKCHDLSSEF